MNDTAYKHVTSEELIRWTLDMVSIPSYCGLPEQEARVAGYIKSVFDKEGIECEIAMLRDGRCNLYAYLRGTGGGRSLMFNGHMDTVPAYDMKMAFDPWMDDVGRIHGRGASDMKGPLATMMATLITIKRGGFVLKGDVLFAAVADEEEGSLGSISMIKSGISADAAIVGEPLGDNRVGIAQKGLEWFEFDFKGRAVHGGVYKKGVNAILKAVKFIDIVNERLVPELATRQLPVVGESTLNIGVIQGGTQLSTVAGACYVQIDRRFLPGVETYGQCCAELQRIVDDLASSDPDFNCTMKVLENSVMEDGYVHQGFIQDVSCDFIQCVRRGVSQSVGCEAELIGCPAWTDAGLISHYAHMPVVVYGPGFIEYAHSKEEYITLDSMGKCLSAYLNIVNNYCG